MNALSRSTVAHARRVVVRVPPMQPEAVLIAPGVRRLLANNPSLMTGAGTNTYLLGEREVAVLDPGPDDARHLERIRAQAPGPIRWVLVTHTHRDHSPLAAALAAATHARVIGRPPPGDGRQDEQFRPDEAPPDGARLVLGETVLTVIHTPGHASNCVCYLHERERLLFTGDHVLGGVSPVILHPDGDMGAYLDSLVKLAAFDFERIAPGHGDVLSAGKRVLEALRAHRLAREAKVLAALRSEAATLDELTARVYEDVPVERHPWARLTLEAHLVKLEREHRAARAGERWKSS